jgi:hypothetical protein
MDKRAKRHIDIAKRSPRHFMIAAEPWSIWYGGKKLMSDFTDTLYDLVHLEEAKTYWKQKDNLSDAAINTVNWDLIGIAMKKTSRPRRIFLSKHASGMCGVGKFMKRWQLRQDDSCPRCGMAEDSAHVWKCHGEGVEDVWDKSMTNLENWLTKYQTDPDIKHAILSHLKTWRHDQPQASLTPFLLENTILKQSQIGWRRFFEGWLVQEWTDAQQAYYKISKSLRSGKRWTIELIKKLWDVAWDLWEHRNSILHEAQNVVTDRSSRSLNRQVSLLFSELQSHLLPAHDRHLLAMKLARLLKKDSTYKEVWLRNAQAALQGITPRQKTSNLISGSLSGMRRRMKMLLTPRRSNGNP